MKRGLLAIGLAVVVACVVGLWWLLRKPATVAPPAGSAVSVPTEAAPPAPSPSAPHLPGVPAESGSSEPLHEGSDPASYTVGGVAIRDHRGGDAVPMDMSPNLHAPDSRKLPATLVTAITARVKTALYQCAADVPREARGAQPRLEGQITVSVKEHVLTIDATTAKVRDVVGAALEPTQQCIEKASTGLAVPAADEADLAAYTISVSYLIP